MRFRDAHSAQYCPVCLSEEAYHRRDWFPVAASACLRHRCLLSDRCGQCGKPVSIHSIVRNCCQLCGFRISNTDSPSIDNDEIGLFSQRLIQNWIGTAPLPMPPFPFSMPCHSPIVLYNVMEGIRSSLGFALKPWFNTIVHCPEGIDSSHVWRDLANIPKASPLTMYVVFAAAVGIMGDWPIRFREFLHNYPLRNGSSDPSGIIYKDYGSLYYNWLENQWRAPDFQFVQEEFNQFVLKEYGVTYSVKKTGRYNRRTNCNWKNTYMEFDLAARSLGLSMAAFNQLIKKGRLHEYRSASASSYSRRKLVSRSEVNKLMKEWGCRIDLEKAAMCLNLGEPIIRELINEGLIKAYSGPGIDGNPRWIIGESGIQSLSDSICKTTSILPDTCMETCDLTQAAKMLSGYGVNLASIIKRVLQGKIIGYFLQKEKIIRLGNLVIPRETISLLQKDILTERKWISRSEIARKMQVKELVVARWVSSGLLAPVSTINHVQYFKSADYYRFHREYVFTEAASQILEIGSLTVQKWARNGRLAPVAGPKIDGGHRYLFHRKEIERLRPENRITGPQLAKRVGISRGQICARVRSGKLHPISGPRIDKSAHYLFSLADSQ
jgi:hypothetical protein